MSSLRMRRMTASDWLEPARGEKLRPPPRTAARRTALHAPFPPSRFLLLLLLLFRPPNLPTAQNTWTVISWRHFLVGAFRYDWWEPCSRLEPFSASLWRWFIVKRGQNVRHCITAIERGGTAPIVAAADVITIELTKHYQRQLLVRLWVLLNTSRKSKQCDDRCALRKEWITGSRIQFTAISESIQPEEQWFSQQKK